MVGKTVLFQMILVIGSTSGLVGADWLQFRGNHIDGVSTERIAPISLKTISWKATLPGRGLSGPIVIGDRVVVTSSTGYKQNRLHVLCFDAGSGKQLWHRQFWATGRTQSHPKMCGATPTPASDGERIFAFYSSNDVACLDLDGNLLWFRGLTHDYPNASNSLGMASSPIVVEDTLIVQVENEAESFATGLDVRTGIPRWKQNRPRHANWTTPTILPRPKHSPLVVLQSTTGLSAINPKTGRDVWRYNKSAASIPSSVISSSRIIYVPSGGLTALVSQQNGSPRELWHQNRLSPSMASPLVVRDRVYVTNRAGVVTAADARTGKTLWRMRLKGPFSGTPVSVGGRLYFFNEKGLGQAVKPESSRGRLVETINLAETVLCTPAIANGALYIRSDGVGHDGHLWKIGK